MPAALQRMPTWARVLVVLAHAASSALLLARWWPSIWPNMAAAWICAVPAVAAAAGLLVHHVNTRLHAHHQSLTRTITAATAAPHVEEDPMP